MPSKYVYALPPHPIRYELVAITDLHIDPAAQRTLNDIRAQGIFKNLVPEALGALIINERANGDKYVVDGFHRKRVCELAGITHIMCEVHEGLNQQEEAILFLIKNRESAKPNKGAEYNVGLTAGLPLFVDTEKVLVGHGLTIANTSTVNTVAAVAGVLKVTDLNGPDILDRVLTIAEKAWGRTAKSWDGMILCGLGRVLFEHPQVVDKELTVKLMKQTPQGWITQINSVATHGGIQHSGSMGRVTAAYLIFVRAWNTGLRTTSKRIVL